MGTEKTLRTEGVQGLFILTLFYDVMYFFDTGTLVVMLWYSF